MLSNSIETDLISFIMVYLLLYWSPPVKGSPPGNWPVVKWTNPIDIHASNH